MESPVVDSTGTKDSQSRKPCVGLTEEEKSIIKALLDKGEKQQDVQQNINTVRDENVDAVRIGEIAKTEIEPADDATLEKFNRRLKTYNTQTGLNEVDHERLIRSREAMISAVQQFNNPAVKFKSEQFCILAVIAWTYLLHEDGEKKEKRIKEKKSDDRFYSLSKMLNGSGDVDDLSAAMTANLREVNKLRNKVSHRACGEVDGLFFETFQACCLNYDAVLKKKFGDRLSLTNELSLALQFVTMDVGQVKQTLKYNVPPHIQEFDVARSEGLSEDQKNSKEYRFKVSCSSKYSSRSKSNVHFTTTDGDNCKNKVRSVAKPTDIAKDYPYRPGDVVKFVKQKSGKKFTTAQHTYAWKFVRKVRPMGDANDKRPLDKKYCYYSDAGKCYTYSDAWVDLIVENLESGETYKNKKNQPAPSNRKNPTTSKTPGRREEGANPRL